jgi:hypothetical protein
LKDYDQKNFTSPLAIDSECSILPLPNIVQGKTKGADGALYAIGN